MKRTRRRIVKPLHPKILEQQVTAGSDLLEHLRWTTSVLGQLLANFKPSDHLATTMLVGGLMVLKELQYIEQEAIESGLLEERP